MAKLSLIFLTLSLAFTYSYAGDNPYGFINALESIQFFFPTSKGILSKFIKICTDLEKVMLHLKKNQQQNEDIMTIKEELKTFGRKLSQISTQIQNVEDEENKNMVSIMKEIHIDMVLLDAYKSLNSIDIFFKDFLTIINPNVLTSNATIESFVSNILSSGDKCKMRTFLPELEQSLFGDYFKENILILLANIRQSDSVMCKREKSSIAIIQKLFKRLIVVEMKGLIMAQYAFATRMTTNPKIDADQDTEAVTYIRDVGNRMQNILHVFKHYISIAPRDFWNCEEEGLAYFSLGRIFQRYYTNEYDLGHLQKTQVKFGDLNVHNSNNKTSVDMCISEFCIAHKNRCNGYLRECDDKIIPMVSKACYDVQSKSRRLNYVESESKDKAYGDESKCKTSFDREVGTGFLCTCDEQFDDESVRFFNLNNVTSDISANKVVIGVKIEQDQNLIHLRIQQAQLAQYGNVNMTTAEWKPVEKYNVLNMQAVENRNYFKITWENRSVSLNTVDAPPKTLLTGVRFRHAGDHLMLEIRYTPFDYISGQLQQDQSKWHSVDDYSKRTESRFDKGLPVGRMNSYNNELHQDTKYIKFTTSDLESDLGQTVVPFIDMQSVTSVSLVSGAGLIHKVATGSAGVLSLKLLNYDMSSHMDDERINMQDIIDNYKQVNHQTSSDMFG